MRNLRRRLTITLHWTTFLALYMIVSAGREIVWLSWTFTLSGLAMVALFCVLGLMNRDPGPKLQGPLRALHPWLSRAMYVLLAWTAVTVGADLLDRPLPGPAPYTMLIALFWTTFPHAIFHLWRHTALRDGALRRMMPRYFHKTL